MNQPQLQSELDSNPALELTPGRMLAAARSEQHLTIADVANRLKLSVSQVEALENDAYDRLPGPVFVRGFIRNYARLVKLDSDRLMSAAAMPAVASEARDASQRLEVPLQEERRWPRYVAVAAVIFVVAAAIDFLWPETDTRVATSGAPAGAPSTPPDVPTPSPAENVAAATVGSAQPVNAPAVAQTSSEASQPEAAPALVREPEATPAAPGQLRLTFTERSWVEIRDRDGRIILSQLNAPGTTRDLNGAAPLKLVIGNAHGVHVIYKERPVDLTKYIRVDVARLTLE